MNTLDSPLQFSFDDATGIQSARAYLNLLRSIGLHKTDASTQLTKSLFDKNSFILAFNLTREKSYDSNCSDSLELAALRAEFQFKTALTDNIIVFCYLEWNSELLIDSSYNIIPELY